MKRIIINQYGGPEVLEQEHIDSPVIKENQILVEQKATSLNPVEIKVRKGEMKLITGKKFPKTLGSDFSGIVIESKCDNFKIGDEVYGLVNPMKGGSYAEQIVVEPAWCTFKPSSLSLKEAGVVSVVGLACLEALIYHGKLNKGETVFINGCTGGVGSFAVLLSKAIGAEVTGTCSAKNIEFANKIGVDNIIDYSKQNLSSLTKTFDLVFDTTGKLTPKQLRKLGKKSSKYSTTGLSVALLINSIFSKSLKLIVVKPDSNKLKDLRILIDKHKVKPVISNEWAFEDMESAHMEFERYGGKGKILINVN